MDKLFKSRWHTPHEIAACLGVCVRTVYRWISSVDDPLPAHRTRSGSGVLRVHGDDINAYLEAHQVNPLEE
jgi:excisionase family DNA binding protein